MQQICFYSVLSLQLDQQLGYIPTLYLKQPICFCSELLLMTNLSCMVHGHSKWLGWLGFGPTTIVFQGRIHTLKTREDIHIKTSKPSRLGKWLLTIVQLFSMKLYA